VVYEAHDTGLGRGVALKLLRTGARLPATASQEAVQREAAAVARLAHPNIVTLHDFGTCPSGPYLIMELLHGESLQRRLGREPIPPREALRISIELAKALEHAHGEGILHRDLKPGNLFLTRDGGVKVLDFGLALVLGASARLDGGTPAYMSPEQWCDAPQDGRADVWSAAVLLHQLLTGELPFHPGRGWVPGGADQVLRVPSIPGAPPWLAPLLRRALAVEPGDRPADGRAWREALEAVRAELEAAPAATPSTGIAVLPFTDLGDPGPGDVLAASLTDLLIAELGRLPSLRVSSRGAAMAYRGSTKPIGQIGSELGVEKVIEGSVLRTDDLLQISCRLLDAVTGRQEWTERYRQPIGDVLDLLDGVARQVGGALGALLEPDPAGGGGRSVAARAMDGYLRGAYHQSKRTPDGFSAALAEYRAAVDAEPLFAAPYVGMAFVHTMSAIYAFAPVRESLALARLNAERALAIDPACGEAMGALAGVQLFHDHDFPTALATGQRAIQASPSHLMSRVVLGDVLWAYDRVDEAMAQIEVAHRLDPLDLGINMNVGDFLVFAGRIEAAIDALRRLLRLNPHFLPGHIRLAKALAFAGDRAGAEAELDTVAASAPEPLALETTALCLATLGDVEEARPMAQELERRALQGRGPAIAAANASGALGDAAAALPMLERAWAALEPYAIFAHRYPATRGLFERPDVAAFGRRVGLPRFREGEVSPGERPPSRPTA
jgi:TolB-like protein/tetratricopeptide (TPR) repeat protein